MSDLTRHVRRLYALGEAEPIRAVGEAEALPELLAIGWHALDLRAVTGRQGKPEWLTCSERPHRLAWPAQLGLWAVAP